MKPEIRVAIIFTADAGESLARLASSGHVWVVKSPSNERAVQAYWQNLAPPFSVTMFDDAGGGAPALARLGIVEAIEGHRCDYSDTYEYPVLEVVGLPLDESAADYLRAFGFNGFEERSDGFVAHR